MERDNTPFGGAQNAGNGSQPQIFSTDQTSQDKQSISSKLGTSRSRFNSRANRYAEQQANFSAAQSIAQNQNTPQFFSDAVMANTPAPVEPPKKSKAPLFIGLAVALVAVVAVVLVVVLLPKGDGSLTEEERKELMVATFNDEDVGNINKMETLYRQIASGELRGDDLLAADFHEKMQLGAESYRKVYDTLEQKVDDIKKVDSTLNLDGLLTKMKNNISRVEESYKNYDYLYSAILESDKSKLDNISNDYPAKNDILSMYNAAVEYIKYKDELKKTDCSNATIIDPITEYDECDAIEDKLDNAWDKLKKSRVMNEIFIGANAENLKDSMITDELNIIYLKVKDSGVITENEK